MASQTRHVRESLREVDNNTWLFGDRILLSRGPSPTTTGTSWSDGHGSFYTLSEAPSPPPPSRLQLTNDHIEQVYDAGDASAVWDLGDAFCKAKKCLEPESTREHTTLAYLHSKPSLSFNIPHVYYHAEYDGVYYIISSKVAGETLGQAWLGMDSDTKHHYVCRVANICRELAAWQNDSLSGVDGGHLPDRFLAPLSRVRQADLRPATLAANCEAVGMDCTTFLFYHCDLGPGNVLVDAASGAVGVIDWETAGFVPREWIRTRFHVCAGLDLDRPDGGDTAEWRVSVARRLKEEGWPEIVDKWYSWWTAEES